MRFLEERGFCWRNAHPAVNKINFVYIHVITIIAGSYCKKVMNIIRWAAQNCKKSFDSKILLSFCLGLLFSTEHPPSSIFFSFSLAFSLICLEIEIEIPGPFFLPLSQKFRLLWLTLFLSFIFWTDKILAGCLVLLCY